MIDTHSELPQDGAQVARHLPDKMRRSADPLQDRDMLTKPFCGMIGVSAQNSSSPRAGNLRPITEFPSMFGDTARHLLTRIGQLATHPIAFCIVVIYAMAWLAFSPATFGWERSRLQPGRLKIFAALTGPAAHRKAADAIAGSSVL
jgi:hypothetical protein